MKVKKLAKITESEKDKILHIISKRNLSIEEFAKH